MKSFLSLYIALKQCFLITFLLDSPVGAGAIVFGPSSIILYSPFLLKSSNVFIDCSIGYLLII
jgi:hypothetical protein